MEIQANSSRFVGRTRALNQLRAVHTTVAANRVALLSGPAGAGKTTLLRHFRAHAIEQGSIVGWGVAGEWEGAPGLWPWYEALSDIDPGQDVITAGLDELTTPLDMAEMFRNVAMWLLSKGVDQDIVVVIEDLHHAHPTTVELFAYLARRPAMPGVTLLASSRPGHDDTDALRVERIPLDGLSAVEIGDLAQAQGLDLSRSAAEDLARRTDGNPLFVQRLLEQRITGENAPIPPDIAALLQGQIAAVPIAARPALAALSVLGTASIELLQRMTDGASVLPILAAIPDDIIRLDADAAAFRHGLVRDVVYQSLAADERFMLHDRAADVLDDVGSNPVLIAHHLSRAALSNRGPKAAEAARKAAHFERLSGAIGEAAHYFGLASSIYRGLDEPAALVSALVEESEALAQLGRGDDAEQRLIEAASACDNAAETIPVGHRRSVVRAYARLRWLEEPNASKLDANFLVSIARRWLSSSECSADQAVLHTAIATAGDIRGGGLDDVAAADDAIAAADAADVPALVGEARLARRRALSVHPTRFAERRADADTALEIAQRLRDQEFLVRAQRMALTDALAAADRPRVMTLLADEPLSAAGRVQHALASATASALEGRYDEADFVLDDTAKELSYLGFTAPALDFFRIVYAWDQGTLGNALAQYVPLLPSIADPALRAAVALARVIDGETAVATTLIDEALATLDSGEPTTLWMVAIGMLSEAAATIDHPRCADLAAMLDGFSGQCVIAATSAAAWIGAVDRYQGLLAMRLGNLDTAVTHFEHSLAIHQRMHATPWQARSHAALATAYQRTGDDATAREHAAEAARLAAEVGMDPAMTFIGAERYWDQAERDPDPGPPTRSDGSAAVRRDATVGVFERRGDVWAVGLGNREHLVRHSNGLDYLALLLQARGVDWKADELYAHVAEIPVITQSGTGPALDDKAIAAYRTRRNELVEAIEEATDNADIVRAERLREELEFFEAELIAAVGLNGRPRTSGDNAERARVNVRRSISRAINQIHVLDHLLGDHLERSIRTGHTCVYEPGPSNTITWNEPADPT